MQNWHRKSSLEVAHSNSKEVLTPLWRSAFSGRSLVVSRRRDELLFAQIVLPYDLGAPEFQKYLWGQA